MFFYSQFCLHSFRYLRDIAFDYQYVAESFETSVPHSCVKDLCRNVKDRIRAVCKEEGVQTEAYASCRVTQLYDTGVCVYFYFGFLYDVSVLACAQASFALHVVIRKLS